MPLAWDCRNTEASKTDGVKDNVGNYAYVFGIALMNIHKIGYHEMYLHTLEITKKNSGKLAKYLHEHKFLYHKNSRRNLTLKQYEKLVTLFIGSKFTRTFK